MNTARQRLELRAARLLSNLPRRMRVGLSGRPPVRVGGHTLKPELQLALSMLERRGSPPPETMPLEEARGACRRQAAVSGNGPVFLRRSPGLVHGFFGVVETSRVSRKAVVEIGEGSPHPPRRGLLSGMPGASESGGVVAPYRMVAIPR